jgi:hypothetical protein
MIRRQFLARALSTAVTTMFARSAFAQSDSHSMHDMSDMSGMDMSNMPSMSPHNIHHVPKAAASHGTSRARCAARRRAAFRVAHARQ